MDGWMYTEVRTKGNRTDQEGILEQEPKADEIESPEELEIDDLENISGGIGGSNGVARTGSGTTTPPPTLVPLT